MNDAAHITNKTSNGILESQFGQPPLSLMKIQNQVNPNTNQTNILPWLENSWSSTISPRNFGHLGIKLTF